jgi:hypothetical protein
VLSSGSHSVILLSDIQKRNIPVISPHIGDVEWLQAVGYPIVSGIADYWVSRATQINSTSWGIDGVQPPDEYVEATH